MPESTADRMRLVEAFAEHETRANVAMAELRVRTSPDVAMHQVALGGIDVEVGRFADAMPHFERALSLDGAMQHVRRALALDPAYGPAGDNLRRLQQMGIR